MTYGCSENRKQGIEMFDGLVMIFQKNVPVVAPRSMVVDVPAFAMLPITSAVQDASL